MYKVDQKELYETVYQKIKEMIINNEFISGQKLHQQQLADRFGVSRTPLALAFSKLEKEMLIEIIPRRGAFVRSFSRREFEDLYALRLRLEPLGAAEAAARGTEQNLKDLQNYLDIFEKTIKKNSTGPIRKADYHFHMAIMWMSQNDFLFQVMSSFNILIIANMRGLLKDPHKSLVEHKKIFDAVRRHDGKTAEKLMYYHIHDAMKQLKELNLDE